MRDWKGNTIKPGDTIMIVETVQQKAYSKLSAIALAIGSYFIDVKPRKQKGWWPVVELKVIPCFFAGFTGEEPILVYFPDATAGLLNSESLPDHLVICIKGVSDNETEYYLNYFK